MNQCLRLLAICQTVKDKYLKKTPVQLVDLHLTSSFVSKKYWHVIGLWKYIQQVALLRVIAHLKFAYVKFNVLKITYHPEEGCIKVRWQINGISGLKAMALFWKFKILKYSEMMKEHQSVWLDGFSTFFVNADGLITHHIADKMMPDDSKETVEEVANPFTAKLALYLGLTVPKLGDFTS
ncbi:unnamed protein product [Darwinula stevensoni]|uniref:Uncharacterized protein n=1 Tax=Darwinula stevensoni TaxID=69355 RepID=A0A7R9ADB0_9CRUS|nr:unnamed protein product [Darwinula stevensoni]CAG0901129.1 unnamed protein product [Darwinula stevensoni]